MTAVSERAPRRGMSVPFLLSFALQGAVLADLYVTEPGFIPSAAYRHQPWVVVATVVVAVLLWLWVLAATRRRSARIDGPVEEVRGTNGALQPVLATAFIVVAANVGYGHSIPKWLNFVVSDDVATAAFTITGEVAPPRYGCPRARASHPEFGELELCLPEDLAAAVRANPGGILSVTGASSWFGLEPGRYAVAEGPIIEPVLTVGPAFQVPVATPEPAGHDIVPAGKTLKSPRN